MRHVQQLQREEEVFLRRRNITKNTNTLTPAEELMSREGELQRRHRCQTEISTAILSSTSCPETP